MVILVMMMGNDVGGNDDENNGFFFQVARGMFVQGMHNSNHQKHRLKEDVHDLLGHLL